MPLHRPGNATRLARGGSYRRPKSVGWRTRCARFVISAFQRFRISAFARSGLPEPPPALRSPDAAASLVAHRLTARRRRHGSARARTGLASFPTAALRYRDPLRWKTKATATSAIALAAFRGAETAETRHEPSGRASGSADGSDSSLAGRSVRLRPQGCRGADGQPGAQPDGEVSD